MNKTYHKKVSFVMSAYNAERYIEQSIESILSQTHKHFELIIVDDGSVDRTLNIIKAKEKKDKRIKVIINKKNLGLTQSLIKAIASTSSEIIVRQDSDEISKKYRLERLLKFYNDKTVVAVGSNCFNIYSNNLKVAWGYLNEYQIMKKIKYKTIFPHGSSSFRKKNYDNVGGYDAKYKTCQDFDLWNKLFKTGRILMSEDILLERYILKNSVSKRNKVRQLLDSFQIRRKYSKTILNPKVYLLSIFYFVISLIPERIYFTFRKIYNLIISSSKSGSLSL